MLETWEAAVGAEFMNSTNPQPLDLARLLGWVEPVRDSNQMNDTAK
jgi:hypothetical protein